ncbi:MAG: 1,2-phenylacetyl-CoA epoxidase subunit PaaC [Actinomycetota bacterium]
MKALNYGDDNLILAQRLSGWISNAPDLETDIALGNIALDHLGVARALLTVAGETMGKTEDELAMFRSEREFTNLLICELPNGDFAQTLVRQFCLDAYQVPLWELVASGPVDHLAGVAAKAHMEATYHLRFSTDWVIRLGDGTEESHRRAQVALDTVWRFTAEMFEDVETAGLRPAWDDRIDTVLRSAGLSRPVEGFQRSGGRQGLHTEHLGHLLADMQWLARSQPGVKW